MGVRGGCLVLRVAICFLLSVAATNAAYLNPNTRAGGALAHNLVPVTALKDQHSQQQPRVKAASSTTTVAKWPGRNLLPSLSSIFGQRGASQGVGIAAARPAGSGHGSSGPRLGELAPISWTAMRWWPRKDNSDNQYSEDSSGYDDQEDEYEGDSSSYADYRSSQPAPQPRFQKKQWQGYDIENEPYRDTHGPGPVRWSEKQQTGHDYHDGDSDDGSDDDDSMDKSYQKGGKSKQGGKYTDRSKNQPKAGEARSWSVHQRIDVSELDAMEDTDPYRVLMLLAFIEMMSCKDMSDPFGYWPLAGVHGLKWPYKGETPKTKGFCKHSSASFAGWHRPYVWTFEQGLLDAAQRVVDKFTDPDVQAQYEEVLPTLRLCYWDFTNPEVPRILKDKQVTVVDKEGNPIRVHNPFYSFKYPRSPGDGRKGYTERSPRWVLGVKRGSGPWAKELAAFMRSRNFECTYNSAAKCPGNLEQIHNSVHSTLGSTDGELGKAEYAAFDPLFWILHAMVDRVIWLFQNNNHDGTGWQEPDTYHPFSPPGNPAVVGELGYTYRDSYAVVKTHRRQLLASDRKTLPRDDLIGDASDAAGLNTAVAAVQRALDQWSGGYHGFHWQVQLSNFTRYQRAGMPANVFVMLRKMPNAPSLPSSQEIHINPDDLRSRPDFCGSVEGFSDDEDMADKKKRITAAVDLTDCLQRAGINPAVEPKKAAEPSQGPAHPAVTLSQLKMYALAANGTNLTPKFKFGSLVISWTLPVNIRVHAADYVNEMDQPASGGASKPQVVFTQVTGYVK